MHPSKLSLLGPVVAFFLVLLSTRLAAADDIDDQVKGNPKPIDDHIIGPWDHVEASMGFVAGQRRYTQAPFNFNSGAASGIPGATTLAEPFQRAPFDNVNVYGLRYDLRFVVNYIRMQVGVDIPFSSYSLTSATNHFVVGGVDREISVRSLDSKDLRFGIGVEYPIGPVAPYVDILGAVHWVSTGLTVDGAPADYDATVFSFSARAGLRIHVRRWFYATAAGEVGLVGDVRWGTELSVGFAFM
jgi:hypothetical protein